MLESEAHINFSGDFVPGMQEGQKNSPSPKKCSDYYPFGLTMPGRSSNTGNPNDNYKFTGHELDDEAGLDIYHMNARAMDPVLGRFLQIDPHHDNYPGVSPYAYVGNNPLIYSDPTGMDWYLNLQQGRVVWFDGSDDRYDDGFVNLGELSGQDETSIGEITDRLGELGYEYGMSAEEGLVVDTEGRYKAWAMEQIFSPENVGLILALGEAGSADAIRRQGASLFKQEVSFADDQLPHIFRNRSGHFAKNTAANRRAILNTAGDRRYYLGKDQYGNEWYGKLTRDGKQVWAQVEMVRLRTEV